MAAVYTLITLQEMHDFLEPQGFKSIQLPSCYEVVYGKLIAKDMCVRVFTSIAYTSNNPQYVSRPVGGDAIRVCLVKRYSDGYIKGIGGTQRVNRTQGWKRSLQQRIDEMIHRYHSITLAEGHRKGA